MIIAMKTRIACCLTALGLCALAAETEVGGEAALKAQLRLIPE